jgi:hypothetical protein
MTFFGEAAAEQFAHASVVFNHQYPHFSILL